MGEVKQIDIKNQTYYLYSNMINLQNFDSSLLQKTKSITKGLIFTLDTSQLRKLMIAKIFTM